MKIEQLGDNLFRVSIALNKWSSSKDFTKAILSLQEGTWEHLEPRSITSVTRVSTFPERFLVSTTEK